MRKVYLVLLFVLISCSSTEESTPKQLTNNGYDHNVPKTEPLKNKAGNHYVIETSKDGHDDAIMELNQNLTFYCMKKTRLSRFKTEKVCLEYVQNTLDDCEKKFKVANTSLVKCVKKKLNLK